MNHQRKTAEGQPRVLPRIAAHRNEGIEAEEKQRDHTTFPKVNKEGRDNEPGIIAVDAQHKGNSLGEVVDHTKKVQHKGRAHRCDNKNET